MLTLTTPHNNVPPLVQRLEPNAVLYVERLEPHGNHHLVNDSVLFGRSVRAEPCALLWHDGDVLGELRQNELVQGCQVPRIRDVQNVGVVVVDGGQPLVPCEVEVHLVGIAEVLGLYKRRYLDVCRSQDKA